MKRKNLHSVNSSHHNQMSKENTICSKNSTQKMKKISKYFFKTIDQTMTNSESKENENILKTDINESPYKNLSTEIHPIINTSLNEENDFKTPKPIKRIAKSNNNIHKNAKRKQTKYVKKKKSGKQTLITKMLKDNFQTEDVNADHLQMALALSTSIQNDDPLDEDTMKLYSSTQEKHVAIKQSLKQFGFKSKSKIEVENRICENVRKPKKSKFQHITPVLYMRTDEDREKMISTKISLILSNIQEVCDKPNRTNDKFIFSEYLRKLHCSSACVLKRSYLQSGEDYLVKSLNLSPCKTKCGHLLKRWEDIPGRDKSPLREFTIMEKSFNEFADIPHDNFENKIPINITNLHTTNTTEECKYSSVNKTPNINKKTDSENIDNKDAIGFKLTALHSSQRTISPDLFSSDEEDFHITKINKIIDHKLESSFEILDVVKRVHSKENTDTYSAETHVHVTDDESIISYSVEKNNVLENSNNKSVLVISPNENCIIKNFAHGKNVDILSASMFSNFEAQNSSQDKEISDISNCENNISHFENFHNDIGEFYDLTQSSDDSIDNDINIKNIVKEETSEFHIHANKSVVLDDTYDKSMNITNYKNNIVEKSPGDKFISLAIDKELNLTSLYDTCGDSKTYAENINDLHYKEKDECYENNTSREFYDLTHPSNDYVVNARSIKNINKEISELKLQTNTSALSNEPNYINIDLKKCPRNTFVNDFSLDKVLNSTQSLDDSYDDSNTSCAENCSIVNINDFREKNERALNITKLSQYSRINNKPNTNNISTNFLVKGSAVLASNNCDKNDVCEFHDTKLSEIDKDTCKENSFMKMISIENQNKIRSVLVPDMYHLDDSLELNLMSITPDTSEQNTMNKLEIISDSDTDMEDLNLKKTFENDTNDFKSSIITTEAVDIEQQNSGLYDYKLQTNMNVERMHEQINPKITKHDSFKSETSECSQASIYISDEELNYSSFYSTPYKKYVNKKIVRNHLPYTFSDFSDDTSQENDFCNNVNKQTNSLRIPKEMCTENTITDKEVITNNTMAFVEELLDDTHYKHIALKDNSKLLSKMKINQEGSNNARNQCSIISNITGHEYFEKNYEYNTCVDDKYEETSTNPLPLNVYSTLQHPRLKKLNTKSGINIVLQQQNHKILQIDDPRPSTVSNTPGNKFDSHNDKTPDGALIIKTDNVTPMPDYDSMDTPKIVKELEKFGVKNLKRKRGMQILKHIYDSTHPTFEMQNTKGDSNISAKRKKMKCVSKSRKKLESQYYSTDKYFEANRIDLDNFNNMTENNCKIINETKTDNENIEIIGDLLSASVSTEDLIFEKTQSSKMHSCRVPLHIVWHNIVSSQPTLKENILLYEPLQLEVLYTMLKEYGFKYHIQDLLTFLDKKCITVRINQNQGQNRRKKKV